MSAVQGERTVRAAIASVCRKLWERGLVAGQDGNVSARLDAARILITPAGLSKGDVGPDDLVVVGRDGTPERDGPPPSSEMLLHLRAYDRRDDVAAVVHAHPPTATAFALAGETLPDDALPEVTVLLGPVPLVAYAVPGSAALADAFEPFWAAHDTFLMANHGAMTLGDSLLRAHQRMETLEHAARIILTARTLGPLVRLGPDQVRALTALRPRRPSDEHA